MIEPKWKQAWALAVLCLLFSVSCSDSPTSERAANPKIEIEKGMRYFVGGPLISVDRYGRSRIKSYEGEVLTPPSRGVVIGLKQDEDGNFESKTWILGRLVSLTKGLLGSDGLQRPTYKETYSGGKVIWRQWIEYDNAAEKMKIKHEMIDPESGKVVKTNVLEVPMRVAKKPLEDDEFFADEEEGEQEDQGK